MTAVYGEPRPRSTSQGWTVDDSTFGARLALVRQRMQWNIKEAARECGIPAASWGTWENGALPRRYTEMCRLIAERTGCDYLWLLDGQRIQGGDALNKRLGPARRTADPLKARPISGGPFSGGRRDAVRPASAIPAARRRPQVVRTSKRPKAA